MLGDPISLGLGSPASIATFTLAGLNPTGPKGPAIEPFASVGLRTAIVHFNTGTGVSDIVLTPGFYTGAILLWWSGATALSAYGSRTSLRGIGFCNLYGTLGQYCASTYDQDAAATAITSSGQRTDCVVGEIGASDTWVGRASLKAKSPTTVTLQIDDAFDTDLYVTALCIGSTVEADLTDPLIFGAEAGIFTAAGSAPAQQNVGITNWASSGGPPGVVFFCTTPGVVDPPTNVIDSSLSFGVGVGLYNSITPDQQPCAVIACGANDAATSGVTGSYARSNECLALHNIAPQTAPGNRAEYQGGFGLTTTPGFQINWLARAQALRIGYLAIRCGTWTLASILTQTDTTTPIVVTGARSQPVAGVVLSAGKAETTAGATPAAQAEWSIGAFTSSSIREAQAGGSRDGNTTMFTQTAAASDAVYVNGAPTTDTVEGIMDIYSVQPDGATFIMDDADPSQAWAAVLLFSLPLLFPGPQGGLLPVPPRTIIAY